MRCSLIMADRVAPMFCTDTPSSAARFLSMRTMAWGWVSLRSLSRRTRPGNSRGAGQDLVAPIRQRVVVRPAEHELHGLAAAAPATARSA